MNKKLEEYSRDELIEEIKSLKRRKKFGLVWEDKKEEIVEKCKNEIPVLKEVSELAINDAPGEPTNLIIEGDNFASLQVLNYTHHGKIDVIYIDPPYNTGNKDFIYNDSYVDSEDSFRHSKWLSFMNRRLRLAKELLSDDGVIFISIDDNEYASLKLLCDDIFTSENFIESMIWKKTENIKMDSKFLSQNKDYVLMYRKTNLVQVFNKEKSTEERFKLEDEKGKYYLRKLDSLSSSYSKGMDYIIEHDGISYYPGGSEERWRERQDGKHGAKAPTWLWSKKKYEEGLLNNEIVFKNGNVYNKVRYDGLAKKPFVNIQSLVSQQTGQKELDDLFGYRAFDHPKPSFVIKWLVKLVVGNENANVLDFFAGSGTTGQAVLELNKEDGGNRKFILCTNNESNIARDVTYPRIKTVVTGIRPDGSKYSDGIPANVRYFTTDFIEKGITGDVTRAKLFEKSDEMIQIRENAFEFVDKNDNYTFYKNNEKFVAIIKDPFNFGPILYELEEKNVEKLPVKLYVFSYSNYTFEDEIPDTDLKYEICAIPNSIMEVYRKISDKKEERK